jgi:hypothetical protein
MGRQLTIRVDACVTVAMYCASEVYKSVFNLTVSS